jgi:hypothetical protein
MKKTQLDLEIGIDKQNHKQLITTVRKNQKTAKLFCVKCRHIETFKIIGLILETHKNKLVLRYY